MTDPAHCHHPPSHHQPWVFQQHHSLPVLGANPCSSSSGQCEVARGTVLCPCACPGVGMASWGAGLTLKGCARGAASCTPRVSGGVISYACSVEIKHVLQNK